MKRVVSVVNGAALLVLCGLLGSSALLARDARADSLEGALARIAERGTISIGYRELSVPFSYLAEDGTPQGYTVDLCRHVVDAIRKEIGLETLEIEWVPVSARARFELVQSDRIQMECGSTSHTISREDQVGFSHVVFITGAKLLVRKGSSINSIKDLDGKRIAISRGTTSERTILIHAQDRGIELDVLLVRDHDEGFNAVATDQTDAYVSDHILLHGLIHAANARDAFEVVGDFLSYDPYAIVLPRLEADLIHITNRTLARLYRGGVISDIYERWFFPMRVPMEDLLRAAFILQAFPE